MNFISKKCFSSGSIDILAIRRNCWNWVKQIAWVKNRIETPIYWRMSCKIVAWRQGHIASKIKNTIMNLGWDILQHSAHSLNIAPIVIFSSQRNTPCPILIFNQWIRSENSFTTLSYPNSQHFSEMEFNSLKDGLKNLFYFLLKWISNLVKKFRLFIIYSYT